MTWLTAAARWEAKVARGWHTFKARTALTDNLRARNLPPRTGTPVLVDRFANVLSVLAYDDVNRLFVMNRGGETAPASLGRVWELAPILAADEGAAQALLRLLRTELPPESTVAVSLYAEPLCDAVTADFVSARAEARRLASDAADVLSAMAEERRRLFEGAAKTGRLGRHAFPVRRFRVWCTVTSPADLMTTADAAQAAAKAFAERLAPMEAALRRAGLAGYVWGAADYTATMRRLVNPQALTAGTLQYPENPAHETLRNRTTAYSTLIDVTRDTIRFHDALAETEAVALGVAGYPATLDVNDMGALLGASARAGTVLTTPYLVTVVVEPTDTAADRATTAVKAARIRQMAGSEIGPFLPDLTERARDVDLAHAACEAGPGLAKTAVEMVVYGEKGKGAAAAEAAKALFADAGFVAETDAGVQMMGLLTALPLEAAGGLMKDLQAAGRLSTKTKAAAAAMLPVIGEWAGTGPRQGRPKTTPLVLLTSRAGTLFGVDFFANRSGNYNAVIAGTSGSGKSVLAQEIVMGVLAGGGRVWVFDIGRSYRNCVELAQGQWVDFEGLAEDSAAAFCLNPLDVKGRPEDVIDEVTDIVSVLANGDVPMELTEAALLKAAVAELLTNRGETDPAPTITDLAIKLSASEDPRLVNLGFRLAPYTAGERFGRWFEGENTVRFEAAMVALEMEALTNKPVLQQAVLLILIMQILQEIRKTPRDQVKLIVIDEAWRLLTGRIGRFIEWACRTLRKYGAGIVCISQSMEDFEATPAARAVRTNADTVFWLRQKAAGVAAATTDPAVWQVLTGLTTEDGLFSEVFVRVGDGPGAVGRLVLDTFSLTAYSTRADVFEAVAREKAKGLSPREAIAAVAATRVAPERGF